MLSAKGLLDRDQRRSASSIDSSRSTFDWDDNLNRAWVGICGEMGGHPLAAPLLLGMGINELSVVPAVLPEIKKIIRTLRFSDMQNVARIVLTLSTGEEVRAYLRKVIKKACPDIPLDDAVAGG